MKTRDFLTPNDFQGSDVSRINQAIAAAAQTGQRVVIPRQNATPEGVKDVWLLDSAILVHNRTTLELNNCIIKLSDRCRDNMIRSANCGVGITAIEPMHDVCIYGVGQALLKGADRPRATGDSGKRLGCRIYEAGAQWETFGSHSYGTDAGVEGEKQTSDWRNIGILLAYVQNFRLEGLCIKDSHAWAISLEHCSAGYIGHMTFDSHQRKWIDGADRYILNQDGLDLRLGCHDITIENIAGIVGDDLVALTNIADPDGAVAGTLDDMQVSGNQYLGEDDDLHNIIIRNVRGYSAGGHQIVRILNTRRGQISNVIIDGVLDASPCPCKATVLIGSQGYGGRVPLGHTRRLFISNISGASLHTIHIDGTLSDSIITNVVHSGLGGEPITYTINRKYVQNVATNNLITPSDEAAISCHACEGEEEYEQPYTAEITH